MKRKMLLLIIALAIVSAFIPAKSSTIVFAENANITVSAKGAYLMDYDSGTVVYAYNENERLPIASMTKIMTALIVFEEIENGKLSFDSEVTVSPNAAGMGGSQVFLDANTVHTVNNLIKSVIISSANDSSVALAETIAGSETGFVNLMNRRAKELGLTNTNFTNCTGLPALNAYSSAKDVSIMLKELIKHPKYFEFSTIWLENYVHPDNRETEMTNTNKLIRFYKGCDAGKTGFTSEALYCLSASAKRGDMRLIATVVGEKNSKTRFADVSNMFNYAFGAYENKILYAAGDLIDNTTEVTKGKTGKISITPSENISAFTKKGDSSEINVIMDIPEKIKAPIEKGDIIGKATIIKNGVAVNEVDLIAAESEDKANFGDVIRKICEKW